MSATGCTSTLNEYLELTFTNDDGTTSTTNVYACNNGKLYKITFYSELKLTYITVIAKVTQVLDGFISITYFDGLDAEGLCPCAHKNVLLNYVSTVSVTIPVNYITSMEEYIFEEPEEPKEPVITEVTKVSILGISAEFIHSIVVRLRIFENGTDCDLVEAIPVDMKVGSRYNVSFIDHDSHAMYEIDGVLKAINIDQNFGDEDPNHGFVRHECKCNQHDMIGMNNVCYDPCDTEKYDMEHFFSLPKSCPESVSFVFDTSQLNESTFDTVLLSDIRGVTLVEDVGDIEITDSENPDNGNTTTPPQLTYPCCGSCCGNTEEGCMGFGSCCGDKPTNIPNPHPPIHHHKPDCCPPSPPPPFNSLDFLKPIYGEDYKAFVSGTPDNIQIRVKKDENDVEESLTIDISLKDLIESYLSE